MGFAIQLPTYLIRIADSIQGIDDNAYWDKYIFLAALNDTSDQEMDEQILRSFKDEMAWWVTEEAFPQFEGRHVHRMFVQWLYEIAQEGYEIGSYAYDLSDMDGVDRVATFLYALGRMKADAVALKHVPATPNTPSHVSANPVATTASEAMPSSVHPNKSLHPQHQGLPADNPPTLQLNVAGAPISVQSEIPDTPVQSVSSGNPRREVVQVPPLPSMDANNDYSFDFYLWGLPVPPAPRPHPVQFANPTSPTRAEIKAELKKVSHTLGTLVTKASHSLSLAHEAKLASSHHIEMLYILRAMSRDVGNPFPSDERLHPKYRDRYPSINHNNAPIESILSGDQPASPPPVRRPRSKYVTPPPPPPDPYVHHPDEPQNPSPEALETPIPDKPDHTPEAQDIIITSDSHHPPRLRNNHAANTEIVNITFSSDSEHSPAGPQSNDPPAASNHATDSDNPDDYTTESEGPDDAHATESEGPDDGDEDSDMSADPNGPDADLAQPDEEGSSSDSDESMNSDDLLGDDGTYSEPGYEEVIPRAKNVLATRPASPHLMDVGMDGPAIDRNFE